MAITTNNISTDNAAMKLWAVGEHGLLIEAIEKPSPEAVEYVPSVYNQEFDEADMF